MTKGENTRNNIIAKSAELFNQQGYAGSSLSDITALTGIKKGGIYRHFENKDEIAVEAYRYAGSIVSRTIKEALEQESTAMGKLLVYLRVYENVVDDPPFIGGCPLLNLATESDDGHPVLRAEARRGLDNTLHALRAIISEGIQSGEFRSDLQVDALATFTLSVMEGGIMLSKLEGDNRHVRMNIDSLTAYLRGMCLASKE
ncbi:TetR family transcriptional regulator [Paenibacillus cellulosilyticus]|uniref:TetR family transcriptional regulator n=1 Tax=Paenibacillus cellulosilyticus TaxID=375489 RepID=A0A2V2YYV7_9BACL|nr:TetR/AcrR family transcriptional regulator [Paenibacillus cellulosilyticus]PWW05044.1 TetR family transcriptional regulator [Paenibacillus cellulosilyticus]QKS48601.1 TetR/AcrR family transcriptional regulator [Paenibacillus cellulosilyticus]